MQKQLRNLTQDEVEMILDNHTETETERPLFNVLWEFDDEQSNEIVEFIDSYLDEIKEETGDLIDFIYEIQDNPKFSIDDKWLRISGKDVYSSADRVIDLFNTDEWTTMFNYASNEVMEDFLKEIE